MFHTIEEFYKEATLTKQMIELRNMVSTARIIAHASNRNKKSLGCHFVE
jgi:aspartate oxidase